MGAKIDTYPSPEVCSEREQRAQVAAGDKAYAMERQARDEALRIAYFLRPRYKHPRPGFDDEQQEDAL
jgi:hypothetical protein